MLGQQNSLSVENDWVEFFFFPYFFFVCEKGKCRIGENNTGMLPGVRLSILFFLKISKADMG